MHQAVMRRTRMGRGWLLLGVWCGTLATALPAPAAGPEAPDSELEEVVVTATRTPMPARQAPGSPTILTREQIDATPFRSGPQIDDLLRAVPGMQPSLLSSRYNHPTAQLFGLHGLGNRRGLVLLDGVPLNDGFGGWINWGRVPDTIERVEVVPGGDRKSTRLNSSHSQISYAVFCLKKKKQQRGSACDGGGRASQTPMTARSLNHVR